MAVVMRLLVVVVVVVLSLACVVFTASQDYELQLPQGPDISRASRGGIVEGLARWLEQQEVRPEVKWRVEELVEDLRAGQVDEEYLKEVLSLVEGGDQEEEEDGTESGLLDEVDEAAVYSVLDDGEEEEEEQGTGGEEWDEEEEEEEELMRRPLDSFSLTAARGGAAPGPRESQLPPILGRPKRSPEPRRFGFRIRTSRRGGSRRSSSASRPSHSTASRPSHSTASRPSHSTASRPSSSTPSRPSQPSASKPSYTPRTYPSTSTTRVQPVPSRHTGGYPSSTRPVAGYPRSSRPAGGYPGRTRPVVTDSRSPRPSGGYPGSTRPVAGYPRSSRPAGGHPGSTRPVVTDSRSPRTSGGYPGSTRPVAGYPRSSQPDAGSSFGTKPAGGYSWNTHSVRGRPGGSTARGVSPSGSTARGASPSGSLDNSILPVGGRAKMTKMQLTAKIGKKIGKMTLQFGSEAVKAYIYYKIGVLLDEHVISKFVKAYEKDRVNGTQGEENSGHHKNTGNATGSDTGNGTGNGTGSDTDNDTDDYTDDTTTPVLGELCKRPCTKTDKRICQFSFDVRLYQTLSRACYDCPWNKTDCERPECVAADGVSRMIYSVNKQLPGPTIQVCVGDKILVDVMNNLHSTAITLHWHGVTLGPTKALPDARSTPFMDGAAWVTQCPIPPGSWFRYSFFATDPGTHLWHSGLERGDGLFGALIISQPSESDPSIRMEEHTLVISDWYHQTTLELMAKRHISGHTPSPAALLINGRGTWHEPPAVPPARILVERGKRYRLRLISAVASYCPVKVTLDDHDLIILALDGAPVNTASATKIILNPGERYDVMFWAEQEASARPSGTFWVRVVGGGECEGLSQHAALQYLPANFTFNDTVPDVPPVPYPMPRELFSGACDTPGQRCLSHLSSLTPAPSRITSAKADHTFYLSFIHRYSHNDNYFSLFLYDMPSESQENWLSTPQINYLSFKPPLKPILINWEALKRENCSVETGVREGQCEAGYCECVHVISVPKGALVELVLIREGPSDVPAEPAHLHGYKFWVLSQVNAADLPPIPPPPTPPPPANGTTPPPPPPPQYLDRDGAVDLDMNGQLERNLESPIMKDTVAVPPGGYTIVRFIANHPGVWVLESQVSLSGLSGMALVLQVGTREDVRSRPPRDFPTC